MSNFIPAENLLKTAMQSTDDHPMDEPTHAPSSQGLGPKETVLFEKVKDVLREVYDPEIPVNIYELGLIYDIAVNHLGEIYVRMTLTSPACPVAGTLPIEIETKIAAIPDVTDCEVEVVWEPTYSMNMMSESARLQLGLL
ncbi:Fe-S protein maturation auxiliary factor SufT [Abditibacteriota bacterium]|nr:Fe-S protein maturation auxiliary factor SufT [Abditibacteriota bacterium]